MSTTLFCIKYLFKTFVNFVYLSTTSGYIIIQFYFILFYFIQFNFILFYFILFITDYTYFFYDTLPILLFILFILFFSLQKGYGGDVSQGCTYIRQIKMEQ